MIKLYVKSIVSWAVIILFWSALTYGSIMALAGEGTKTIQIGSTTLTVPESLPDFSKWDAYILGLRSYPNGNAIALVEGISPSGDEHVQVLIAKVKGKFSVIGVRVTTFLPGWETNSDLIKTRIYEDSVFMKTGVFSYSLEQVDNASTFETIESQVSKDSTI